MIAPADRVFVDDSLNLRIAIGQVSAVSTMIPAGLSLQEAVDRIESRSDLA